MTVSLLKGEMWTGIWKFELRESAIHKLRREALGQTLVLEPLEETSTANALILDISTSGF